MKVSSGCDVLSVLGTVVVFNTFFFLIRGSPELLGSPEEREIIPCVLELSEEYVLHHLKAGHFLSLQSPGENQGQCLLWSHQELCLLSMTKRLMLSTGNGQVDLLWF